MTILMVFMLLSGIAMLIGAVLSAQSAVTATPSDFMLVVVLGLCGWLLLFGAFF